MAYVPGVAPVEYTANFFQEEFNRIANAYNFQRAVGELLFDIDSIGCYRMRKKSRHQQKILFRNISDIS